MVERERSRELAAMLTTLANINAGAPPDMREPCFIDEAADMLLALERDLAAARAENARLMRERDAAQEVLRDADKGSPIYKAVERVLDEHSAWIARPNDAVTRAIALAAGVAWMAREPVDPLLEEIEMRLIASRAENDKLREALECIAEEHDAGRHDGLPEPCPAHDADTMFAIACAALAEKEPAK